MPEFFATGQNRLAYRNNQFTKSLTVTVDIYKPDETWDYNNSLTELASGLYYIDYDFPTTGTYVANFYEGNTQTAAQTYRVNTIAGLGGGATAAQVWGYGTRTLTEGASSEETAFISSQVAWISSNLKYGTGGGGPGKTSIYNVPKKSPWTHRQKETILEQMTEVLGILNSLQDKIDESDEKQEKDKGELKGIIDSSIKDLKDANEKIRESQDNNVNDVSNKIDGIIKKMGRLESKVESSDVTSQIGSLYDILVKSLCDDELEKMLDELKG